MRAFGNRPNSSSTEQEALVRQLKDKLPPEVDQQLVAGGEEGTTELILRKWLVARKVQCVCASGTTDLSQYVWYTSMQTAFLKKLDHHCFLSCFVL